jgi:hypothetical protein
MADVATNLITDLLLTLIDKNHRELTAAPFVQPSNLQFSATNRQRTLSKNTQLGHMLYQTELNNYLILPVLSEEENYQTTDSKSFNYKGNNTQKSGSCDPLLRGKRKVQFTDFTCETERCEEQFLSRNNLQHHLHQKCYPIRSIARKMIL